MRLTANERNLQPSKDSDQELGCPVRLKARVGIRGLNLTQRARNYQQPMWIPSHEPESLEKGSAVGSAGVHQVREIFPLHGADIFQPCNGVVAQRKCPLFDACEPSSKTSEIEGILLARINQESRAGRLQLRAASLAQDGNHRVRYWCCGQLPFERRGNQRSPSSQHSVSHAAFLSQR